MTIRLLHGHVLDRIREIPDASVHCVVTSPPYWGLRDYGLTGVTWPAVEFFPMPGLDYFLSIPEDTACLGLEHDPKNYVGHLVTVFREVRRVLRPDGTLWLNLGDCYAGGAGGRGDSENLIPHGDGRPDDKPSQKHSGKRISRESGSLPSGNRLGMPWRVAFALQADGWILRQENIWAKPSPMPEAVNGWRWERCRRVVHPGEDPRDDGDRSWTVNSGDPSYHRKKGRNTVWEACPGCPRCEKTGGFILRKSAWRPTVAHEQVFLFSKSPTYYGDRDAVATESRAVSDERLNRAVSDHHKLVNGSPGQPANTLHQPRPGRKQDGAGNPTYTGFNARYRPPAKANLRSVWSIPPAPFSGAHFATFPPRLPALGILAGTSERGVCPACGAPWVRALDVSGGTLGASWSDHAGDGERGHHTEGCNRAWETGDYKRTTLGWRPSCSCQCADPVPALVFDPFAGAGTTLLVADRLGRHAVGIEANGNYVEIAEDRLQEDAGLFSDISVDKEDFTP